MRGLGRGSDYLTRTRICGSYHLGLIQVYGLALDFVGARALVLANLVHRNSFAGLPLYVLAARANHIAMLVIDIGVVDNGRVVDDGRIIARSAIMGMKAGMVYIPTRNEHPP